MKTTFLIGPVRGYSEDYLAGVVHALENEGYDVYWPARDTDQSDETGWQICCDNERAIRDADVVHFFWDGKSQGCLFDLGMAFALDKDVIPLEMPARTPHKSFQNMVAHWAGDQD